MKIKVEKFATNLFFDIHNYLCHNEKGNDKNNGTGNKQNVSK